MDRPGCPQRTLAQQMEGLDGFQGVFLYLCPIPLSRQQAWIPDFSSYPNGLFRPRVFRNWVGQTELLIFNFVYLLNFASHT